jgi:hypothetical protein
MTFNEHLLCIKVIYNEPIRTQKDHYNLPPQPGLGEHKATLLLEIHINILLKCTLDKSISKVSDYSRFSLLFIHIFIYIFTY